MCWFRIEMVVRLEKLQQLKSKERKDENHLLLPGSATVTREGQTVQGGLFNQNNETTGIESFVPACACVLILTPHLNLNLNCLRALQPSLWLHTPFSPRHVCKAAVTLGATEEGHLNMLAYSSVSERIYRETRKFKFSQNKQIWELDELIPFFF